MNVHHKCQHKVGNLCGINQKLLAEALTQVSQVSSWRRTHVVIIKLSITWKHPLTNCSVWHLTTTGTWASCPGVFKEQLFVQLPALLSVYRPLVSKPNGCSLWDSHICNVQKKNLTECALIVSTHNARWVMMVGKCPSVSCLFFVCIPSEIVHTSFRSKPA